MPGKVPTRKRVPLPFRVDEITLNGAREKAAVSRGSLSAVVEAGLKAYANNALDGVSNVPSKLPDDLVLEVQRLDAEFGGKSSRNRHPNLLNAYLALLQAEGWPLQWIADAMPSRSATATLRSRIAAANGPHARKGQGEGLPPVPAWKGKPLNKTTTQTLRDEIGKDRNAGTQYAAALVRAGWPIEEIAAAAGTQTVRPTKARIHQRVLAGAAAGQVGNHEQGIDWVPRERLPGAYPAPPEITSRMTQRAGQNASTSFSITPETYKAARKKAERDGQKLPIVVEAILRDYLAAAA